ncbi:MAG TPA: hypothetical protein VKB78_14880, partial [Pirellulales bacterium]|nr:hypothetical protein [Pirellulales bacterium]
MSKLLKALKQIDDKSVPAHSLQANRSGSSPHAASQTADAVAPESVAAGDSTSSAADEVESGDAQHFDPLVRIRELNRLLEEALASRRSAGTTQSSDPADDDSVGRGGDSRSESCVTRAAPDSIPQISIAVEFGKLADRLLAEINPTSPAIVTLVST